MLAVQSHFEGAAGAALYLSPPGAESAEGIVFDRFRPLGDRWLVVDPDYLPGEYLLSDASVALVKGDTEIEYSLPDEYLDSSFFCQVRPHENGLELDTIYRPRRMTVDEDGEPVGTIEGRAVITAIEQLAGGGIRVRFEYYPGRDGVQPTEFALVCTDGPTTPDEATVERSPADVAEILPTRYSLEVAELEDGEEYEFELRGRAEGVETVLGTVEFVPDASGPTLSISISAEEES